MSKTKYIGKTKVKKLGVIMGFVMGILLFFILSQSIWINNALSIISFIANLIFIFGLFVPWLYNSKQKSKIYLILFIIFALVSLFNEGVLLNEGSNNMNGFLYDLFIKVFSFIVIKLTLVKRPFSK